MLDIMYRLKIGAITTELSILRPLSQLFRFLPKAYLPMVLHSSENVLKETSKSAASAKTSTDANTIFAGVAAEAEKGEHLDEEDVAGEAGVFTVAGTDTTAVTLTYLVWCVLSRPDLRQTIEEEVAGLPDDYTDPDLLTLPWLNAIISETLRLYGPISSALPRICPPGGAVLGGNSIPGGTVVSTQAYTIHRDPELFPSPLE
jgi:cytochrome P450